MRVTKTVREFIEMQIHAKAEKSESVADLKKKADDAEKRLNEDLERLKEECTILLKNTVDKYNLECSRPPHVSFSWCDERYLPEVRAYNDALAELRAKERKATLDIIAEMELGGTKKELMEMLNSLEF